MVVVVVVVVVVDVVGVIEVVVVVVVIVVMLRYVPLLCRLRREAGGGTVRFRCREPVAKGS